MPIFTIPIHEHGTPGQPNYPHGKGGATRLPAGVSMAVDTVTAKRLGYLAFVETKHEGRTVGRLVLVDPESPAAGSGAREGLFDPDYAVTAQIDIDPPWRGQKLASALYTRAVKFAKAEGFRGIQAGQLNTTSERYWKQWLEAGKAKLAWKNRGSVMVLEHGNLGDKDYPHPMGRGSGEWSTERSRMTAGRHATKGEMRPATAADRKKYAIPPAYTNAMVATDPKAELRATAYSPATGKTASYYTKAYKARQAAAKWSRVMSVHRDMPTLWRKISTSKDQEAMTLRVILRTGLRNGNEGQGEEKAYGASNLRMEHVSVDGDTVRLQFPGKSGVAQDHSFTDSVVADYVRKREKAGAETLFDHTADDTLSYLRQISGGKKLKVHDLRTWHGTVLADALVTTAVREGLIPKTAKEFKAFRKQIGTHVAKALGNTPAVTLSTYIHPSVFRPLEVKK